MGRCQHHSTMTIALLSLTEGSWQWRGLCCLLTSKERPGIACSRHEFNPAWHFKPAKWVNSNTPYGFPTLKLPIIPRFLAELSSMFRQRWTTDFEGQGHFAKVEYDSNQTWPYVMWHDVIERRSWPGLNSVKTSNGIHVGGRPISKRTRYKGP